MSLSKFFFSSMSPSGSTSYPLGKDCRDIAEAKEHARRIAADLVAAQLLTGETPVGWVEISDKQGRSLFMLPLSSVAP